MRRLAKFTLLSLAQITLLVACGTEPAGRVLSPSAELSATSHRGADREDEDDGGGGDPRFSEWSEPVHLGAVVNSASSEIGAELSLDGLSLYFGSDRPGGLGGVDIWVSRRACRECPWASPVNLGPNINSPEPDGGAALSPDGRLLYFSSARAGGEGGDDIWVSRRSNKKDDFAWGPPVNLGPVVNTGDHETGPVAVRGSGEGGGYTLYFVRGATLAGFDIYQVRVTRDGEALGEATPVAELNHPTLLDGDPVVRSDGRELLFWSTRPGGVGGADIWVATRPTVRDPWSTPQSLGLPVNTPGAELTPALSRDGRTLILSVGMNARPSLGRQDLWMSTRTRLDDGHSDAATYRADDDGDHAVGDPRPRFSAWSAPVNAGSVVNSEFEELMPFIARDGLSLYFSSFRPGGLGGPNDIWISRRRHIDAAWEEPKNLGAPVNSAFTDGQPALSRDGHLLYFTSNRPGGFGGNDVYVSRRRDNGEDLAWGDPVNLGSPVNTSAGEGSPTYFEDDATGTITLYFPSGRPGGLGGNDIYATTLLPDGTYSPPVPVAELNSPFDDQRPVIRRDGLEMFIASDRPGTLGGMDIWVSTRNSTSDPWSTPVNLGSLVNTANFDAGAALSFDGATLYFHSALRPGNVGTQRRFDIWMATRSRLKGPDKTDDRVNLSAARGVAPPR